MTALSDLIARLEMAKEGSRELDYKIWRLIAENSNDPVYHRRNSRTYSDLPYTTSLDAALTLVPDGMEWHASNRGQIGAKRKSFAAVYGDPFVGSECDTNAATPALALCIAALKARVAGR